MATIGRNIGFMTESAADHTVVARGIFVEKKRSVQITKNSLALPREPHELNKLNCLLEGLGQREPIGFNTFRDLHPNLSILSPLSYAVLRTAHCGGTETMSATGHKRGEFAMSALPPKADIGMYDQIP